MLKLTAAAIALVLAAGAAQADEGSSPAEIVQRHVSSGGNLDALMADYADDAVLMVLADAEVEIPLASMVDIEAEKQRLAKEIQQAKAEVKRLETMLGKEEFLSKAPPAVVEKERARLETRRDSLKRLSEHLERLNT